MSYILDALTKAAQQRDRRIPVVQRLLTPTVRTPKAPWTRSLGRVFVALAVNAGLLAVLILWWLRPVPLSDPLGPSPAPSVPVAAPTVVEPPRPAVEPLRAVDAPRSATPEPSPKAPVPAEKPGPSASPAAVAPPPRVAVPKAQPPAAQSPPQRPAPPPQPAPFVGAPPVPPNAPAPLLGRTALRLEALIYSDVPSQRMIFINGRRYVEGDLVEGRLRVEEIHEDGVELSEQGRRVTLRAAR